MAHLDSKMMTTLAERAKPHYSDTLPYHNWEHARDVMRVAANLGARAINPKITNHRHLLVVAAAWHDADYHLGDAEPPSTKEERSAELALRLLPELDDAEQALLVSGILDTTVARTPKESLFGEVLHAADVGYFAASTDHFLGRLALMRQEWGSPDWQTAASRTLEFGYTVLSEAKELMPDVLPKRDAAEWITAIGVNLAYLEDEIQSGRLR